MKPIFLTCFRSALSLLPFLVSSVLSAQDDDSESLAPFNDVARPFLTEFCVDCHNDSDRESGISLESLSPEIPESDIKLWELIQSAIESQEMPPEDEHQPSAQQRRDMVKWVEKAITSAKSRPVDRNGLVRRLTVAQYRNTLQDLLGIREDLTDRLPPDAISKSGFTNNAETLQLSPLQIEAYVDIAARALEQAIVDPASPPTIQNFKVTLGESNNSDPIKENLILGANSRLLANQDFVVEPLVADKAFDFIPFEMKTKYRFNEGYEGNSTVRGWRDYDSIYHAVFACMRGNPGYPKGLDYETVQDGLLLRPAIPSRELFGVESTYGPKANFKISLRELPDHGNFRVKVTAAKYDDALLLDRGSKSIEPEQGLASEVVSDPQQSQTLVIPETGIYQVDVFQTAATRPEPDASRLQEELIASWNFDESFEASLPIDSSPNDGVKWQGSPKGGASRVDSPFGQALSVDGKQGSLVIERTEQMNVGEGDFTVSAWIHPREMRQGGIVCLGKYSWTHGWYLDMPNNRGVLRIETANPANEPNGTVASPPNTLKPNTWQHVAAVVERGTNKTRLYVNGFLVAQGTIPAVDLDNPDVDLHIGRIQDSQLFRGEIDNVYLHRRALDESEIQALVEPGRQYAKAPRPDKSQPLELRVDQRKFTGQLHQPAFCVLRLTEGEHTIQTGYPSERPLDRLRLTRLDPDSDKAQAFLRFEKQPAILGVHVGLRRDCGSTMSRVQQPRIVHNYEDQVFVFDGAINDYPSPDVQPENDNYLAGVREIGVRSEYTDGRDRPRLRIRSVEFEGPFYESWPPESHNRILGSPAAGESAPETAQRILRDFLEQAYRRPPTPLELDAVLTVWKEAYAATGEMEASIRESLLLALVSPQFLLLVEKSESPAAEPLDEYELASKLAYFLWNSPPDRQLLELASQNKLHANLESQINRLVADDRFHRFAQTFASGWLDLRRLDVVEIDMRRFPRMTRATRSQLRDEPGAFLDYLIRENLPARNLIDSEFILANEVVAAYYELPGPVDSGFEFVPVAKADRRIGGVITQAGVLGGLSDGREPNPVKRGAWFARKIIAEPPADPPPNVPELNEDLTHLPLRERLARHRNQKGCVKCHEGIDPWGLPFEEYNAGGLFEAAKEDIESTLPDRTQIANIEELRRYLLNERDHQVIFSFVVHLAEYACGRTLSHNEIEFYRQACLELEIDDIGMRDLVGLVVASEPFLTK